MSILNRDELIFRIKNEKNYEKKLMVTPLLTEAQIGPASIDIRLGSSIVIPITTFVESQDVTFKKDIKQVEKRRYRRIRFKYHDKFVLHPNDLILGVTFEYVSLPKDLFCIISSRSSWGRLGLVIATASVVQPGFKGCLTLELANLSESPIALYPGLLIGQLVFYHVPSKPELGYSLYTGRYDCPTEAGLPQFFHKELDEEMIFWREGYKK